MFNLILAITTLLVNTDNVGESYQKLIKEYPNSVTLIYSENNCRLSNNAASKTPNSNKFKVIKINATNQTDQKKTYNFPTCNILECGLPTFIFHKDGKITDIFNHWWYPEEWQKIVISTFYNRNTQDLYPPESITQEMIDVEAINYYEQADHFNVELGQGILINGSFAKRKFKGANFAHSDLRATSFENTIIEGAVFTRANLKGASFKGAKLSNILWGACICPDGTKSSSHGYTCEGHLKPFKYKTIPKTTLKPPPSQRPVPLTDELKDIGKDFEQRLDKARSSADQQTLPAAP